MGSGRGERCCNSEINWVNMKRRQCAVMKRTELVDKNMISCCAIAMMKSSLKPSRGWCTNRFSVESAKSEFVQFVSFITRIVPGEKKSGASRVFRSKFHFWTFHCRCRCFSLAFAMTAASWTLFRLRYKFHRRKKKFEQKTFCLFLFSRCRLSDTHSALAC